MSLALAALASAQTFHTYIGELGPDHVTIAWGTTAGDNTIGRSSPSFGAAKVSVGKQEFVVTDRNWAVVRGLDPDTEYDYEITLNGRSLAKSKFRTWAAKAEKLRFFVIGDFGSGDSAQARLAQAMAQEFQRQQGSGNPVRFVITTGDNIYGQKFGLPYRSGDRDSDWSAKFFQPYAGLLAHIPFYPSLGNHDGNETEAQADLPQYLDNFFVPGETGKGARHYRFHYGGFVDFFALDSTKNTQKGGPYEPAFLGGGEQTTWLGKNLTEAKTAWKIPYFHHPPFNAGPGHGSSKGDLGHWMRMFEQAGVKVVFNGHEHNYQHSAVNSATGGVRYVVSGSGGELRDRNVRGKMQAAEIEGWAPVNQFLSVEIDGKEMRITPIGFKPFDVVDRTGKRIDMPLPVRLP